MKSLSVDVWEVDCLMDCVETRFEADGVRVQDTWVCVAASTHYLTQFFIPQKYSNNSWRYLSNRLLRPQRLTGVAVL